MAEALDKTAADRRLAAVVYGLTLLVIRLLFAALAAYAQREHLRQPRADDPDLQDAHTKFRAVVLGYAVTVLLGLFLPSVAIVLYLVLAVYLIVPFPAVVRLVFGARSR